MNELLLTLVVFAPLALAALVALLPGAEQGSSRPATLVACWSASA
jgi:hypothetical protein